MGDEVGSSKRKRDFRGNETGQQDSPAPKRPAIDEDKQQPCKARQEAIRSTVRGLYQSYKSLCDAARDGSDGAAFQALLQASEGDVASRRLAARLVPRFIGQFPDQVDVAAAALTRLHGQEQALLEEERPLEEQTRQDALNGLSAVLRAAQACKGAAAEHAVKHVLDYLLRLLPQASIDEPSEPEEEGELASSDRAATSVHFLRRVLRQALQLHPVTTLAHCFCCLGAATSTRAAAGAKQQQTEPQLQQGVRLWLKEHLLRETTPSRETTPAGDGVAAAVATAAADGSNCNNGNSAAGAPSTCCLQKVLNTSEELQLWVMQQARGRAAAPPEVRCVLESALQLLPAHQQLAAAKPHIESSPPAAGAARGKQQPQQQRRLATADSLPHYRQQQRVNGVMPGFVNGMEPLGRSYSTPGSLERDCNKGRTAHANLGAAEPRGQFPQPPGPICRVEPCLLVYNLPQHVNRQEVQATLGADEVWLQEQPGSSGSRVSACCTFKGVLEAAKAYLRHNGLPRMGSQQQPITLVFADRLPACSSKAAAAAAEPSAYVWATKEAVGDAESITDELRAAGLQLNHVHRVNNSAEPGTLLHTPSGTHAASVVSYLLKKHPQHQKAAADQADDQELPPLPPEPPPIGEWQGSSSRSLPSAAAQQQGPMPPLPPGPPPPYQQQQDRAAAAPGGLGKPVSPAAAGDAGGGFRRTYSSPSVGGASAAAAAAGGWRDSPSDWSMPTQQQQWASGSNSSAGREQQGKWGQQQQQQQQAYGRSPGQHNMQQPAAAPPPLPPGQAGGVSAFADAAAAPGVRPGMAGSSGGSWHTLPPQQHQQQQPHRWGSHPGAGQVPPPLQHHQSPAGPIPPPAPPPGGPNASIPGPTPPLAPHPGAGLAGMGQSQHLGPLHAQQQRQLPPGGPAQHRALPPHMAGMADTRAGGSAGNSPAAQGGHLAAAGSLSRVLWQGSIVKQSVHMCGVACLHGGGGSSHMAGFAPEPRFWPEQLHVNFRISVADAVEQYAHAAPDHRAVRLLLPLNPDSGDTQQLQQFINYLNGKERAGMVKLPAVREQGLGPRAVYLIVPKAQVCQQLQVVWDGRGVMLIAVVVPQPGGAAGAAPGHPGHRPYRG